MKRLLIIAACAAACVMLTGCPDNKPSTPPTLQEIEGNYKGGLSVRYSMFQLSPIKGDTFSGTDEYTADMRVSISSAGGAIQVYGSSYTPEGLDPTSWDGQGNYFDGNARFRGLYYKSGDWIGQGQAPAEALFEKKMVSLSWGADTLVYTGRYDGYDQIIESHSWRWTFEGTKAD